MRTIGAMAHNRILLVISLISLTAIWLWYRPQTVSLPVSAIISDPLVKPDLDLSRPDAPFVSWPLARVCKEASWRAGIVFICDNNSGGIGNIRNYILTCLRYGIEAGATGLVLPQIRTRNADDLSDIMRAHRGFDYFFDEGHFRSGLQASCPQITIYGSTDDIPNAVKPFRAEEITPKKFGLRGGCDRRDLNKHFDRFGSKFEANVQEKIEEFDIPAPSLKHPRAYRLTWGVQFDMPVYHDGPEFVATYGGLLRFRKDILELGARTTSYMRKFAALHKKQVNSEKFIGLHLRTENDSLSAWPKFEDQSRAYLLRASAMNFGAAYLATGDSFEADRFAKLANSQHGIGVMTKEKLLQSHPQDLKILKSLTWDQQGLIDFIVLLNADYFVGVNPSSFSMNIALKRHLKMEGIYTRPWKIGSGDDRSWIMGTFEQYWSDWLFIYESMWP